MIWSGKFLEMTTSSLTYCIAIEIKEAPLAELRWINALAIANNL